MQKRLPKHSNATAPVVGVSPVSRQRLKTSGLVRGFSFTPGFCTVICGASPGSLSCPSSLHAALFSPHRGDLTRQQPTPWPPPGQRAQDERWLPGKISQILALVPTLNATGCALYDADFPLWGFGRSCLVEGSAPDATAYVALSRRKHGFESRLACQIFASNNR